MSDLTEKLDRILARTGAFQPQKYVISILTECRAALSPVLPDDVASLTTRLRDPDFATKLEKEAADLLERQAREISGEKINLAKCHERSRKKDEHIERLEAALRIVINDAEKVQAIARAALQENKHEQ